MGIVDDYICAICDEGGDLIYCDGECGRCFHPKRGKCTYDCNTLGLSEEQVKLPKFLCKNCEYKQHQCFICGHLGSSDLSSVSTEPESGTKRKRPAVFLATRGRIIESKRSSNIFNDILFHVFQCNKQYCGHFYHLNCLSEYDPMRFSHLKCLLHDPSKNPPDFVCPVHECCSCKDKGEKITGKHIRNAREVGSESEEETEMHLALCRRCPVAYHQKCLPRYISNGEFPRAWQTAGRLFFYCKKHEMVEGLLSASEDHMIFPEAEEEHNVSKDSENIVPELEEEHKVNNDAESILPEVEENQEWHGNIVHPFDLNLPPPEEPEP